ncbi:MAG TPA: trehalose-phosphatase [Streptosporangiaceae bacterium]|jgi:trehalose 6-phosphate phosphatase
MPNPAGLAGLAAIASDPGHALLAFDFDGVLSPIVDDPEQAQALPQALSALARIGQRVGSVAIITGRPVSFMTSRRGFDVLCTIPDFTVYGQYGQERWDASSRVTTTAPAAGNGVADVRAELTRLLEQPGVTEGAWLEDKGSALAVHTRRAADPDGAMAVLTEPVDEIARRHRLRVEPGKLVLELRQPGIHKGDVLRTFIKDRAARSVLYAGDDLGDLSAFAVIDEFRQNDIPGVKVCSGSDVPDVAAVADLVVDGPQGVASLLEGLTRRMPA